MKGVIEAIECWNHIFNIFNVTPFKYMGNIDRSYPLHGEWIITSIDISNLNTSYSATSVDVIDYRTGENICGIIYLCLSRIASSPCRYSLLTQHKLDIKEYIYKYTKYVTRHEIGHELCLRHNFSGNVYPHKIGSIMDYIDIFFDKESLKILDDTDILKYDVEAIKYGYFTDNITNANQYVTIPVNLPFSTDENILEGINPEVDIDNNCENAYDYIIKSLKYYKQQRENILKIDDKYTYNVLFLFIYLKKYPELIEICMKYIGGKIYSYGRNKYEYIDKQKSFNYVKLILLILEEIKYSDEEYKRITYKINKKSNRNDVILVEMDTLYEMGDGKLFIYYKKIINDTFTNILKLHDKLSNNNSNIKFLEVIDKFLFSTEDQFKGLFSYIYDINYIWIINSFMNLLLNYKDNDTDKEKIQINNDFLVLKYRIKHICKIILKVKSNKINYQIQIFIENLKVLCT